MDAVNPDPSTGNGWISLSKAASEEYEALVELFLILYTCRDTYCRVYAEKHRP